MFFNSLLLRHFFCFIKEEIDVYLFGKVMLRLKFGQQKATFLGFQILRGKIRVNTKAVNIFKDKALEMSKRNNPLSMYQIIQELNEYLQGWVGYFRVQEFRQIFRKFDEFIICRIYEYQVLNNQIIFS